MKNQILTVITFLSFSTAHAVSMSWSSTISSSASRIEAAQRWIAQLEENFVPFVPEDSEYLRVSGLSAGANLELITDGFRLNFSTRLEQPTSITLFSFDEEENLSFSRTIGVAPITRDRNGTTQYLYTEEFLLSQEELFPFVDQPLELIALYGSFSDVRMEANVSAIPEPNSAFLLGLATLSHLPIFRLLHSSGATQLTHYSIY